MKKLSLILLIVLAATSANAQKVKVGANPAASNSSFLERSGTSRPLQSASTSSRLACARPVSTKLRWRGETPASAAKPS